MLINARLGDALPLPTRGGPSCIPCTTRQICIRSALKYAGLLLQNLVCTQEPLVLLTFRISTKKNVIHPLNCASDDILSLTSDYGVYHMGRIFRCALAALALLQPLGAEVNATPLRAELLANDQSHILPRFFGDPRSPADLGRLRFSNIFANAGDQRQMGQRMRSKPGQNLHLQARAFSPGAPVQGCEYSGCYPDYGVITKESINFGFFCTPDSSALLALPQNMRAALCTASCSLNALRGRYEYAGLSGETCYCFNKAPAVAAAADATCDTPCLGAGGQREACGSTSYRSPRMTIFKRSENLVPLPKEGLEEWYYEGCYSLKGNTYTALADGLAIGYKTVVDNDGE